MTLLEAQIIVWSIGFVGLVIFFFGCWVAFLEWRYMA